MLGKGTVGARAGATKAYLGHAANQKWVTDSAVVKDDHFEFRGTLPEPVRATLTLGHNGTPLSKSQDRMRDIFYLDQGTLLVNTPDSTTKVTVRGTPINDENARLRAALKPLNERYQALTKAARAQPDAAPQLPRSRRPAPPGLRRARRGGRHSAPDGARRGLRARARG